MSWEATEEKYAESSKEENEGYWLSMQVKPNDHDNNQTS